MQATIATAVDEVDEDKEQKLHQLVLGNYIEPPAHMLFSARHDRVDHKGAGRAT